MKPILYYPILLNLQGKRCVVVGGGRVALRKTKSLIDCGAKATVISPEPHPEIIELSKKKLIRLIRRGYKKEDLLNSNIAFACTDSKKANQKVAEDSKKRGILVNVADEPEHSDFILPSYFRRGSLTIAVSTGGLSPALARKIRKNLEKSFGKEYTSLVSLIGQVRSSLKEKGYKVNGKTWEKSIEIDQLLSLIKTDQLEKAKTFLLNKLKAPHQR